MNAPYIFTSERLGFRNWTDADITPMSKMNADPEVMKYFPATQTTEETTAFIQRMRDLYSEKGFCYFAVDRLDTGEFIGFIGLMGKTFEADFTPCTDIGWRLSRKHWGIGFATEGAKRCLDFALGTLGLNKVVSMCPIINTPSEAVMKKIGMQKVKTFEHPLLENDERLRTCLLYSVDSGDTAL